MRPLKPIASPKPPNVLVWDLENRPLSYWYDGRSTAEVTVIAYKWLDSHQAEVLAMKKGDRGNKKILKDFLPVYDEADILIGHNIRRHDLPILNGAYIENGMEPLKPKATIDTLAGLRKWKDLPRSLEYLCDFLGCPFPKFHMTQDSWRKANRLEDDGLNLARERCAIDVRATEWVYHELLRLGLLDPKVKRWAP